MMATTRVCKLEVKILVLPDSSDPDEFIRKSGALEYQRQRGEAQPHIQFVIDQAVRDRKLSNPADKEAAIDEVLPYIRAVRSRIQKREYFDIAMDSLRIERFHSCYRLPHALRDERRRLDRLFTDSVEALLNSTPEEQANIAAYYNEDGTPLTPEQYPRGTCSTARNCRR